MSAAARSRRRGARSSPRSAASPGSTTCPRRDRTSAHHHTDTTGSRALAANRSFAPKIFRPSPRAPISLPARRRATRSIHRQRAAARPPVLPAERESAPDSGLAPSPPTGVPKSTSASLHRTPSRAKNANTTRSMGYPGARRTRLGRESRVDVRCSPGSRGAAVAGLFVECLDCEGDPRGEFTVKGSDTRFNISTFLISSPCLSFWDVQPRWIPF